MTTRHVWTDLEVEILRLRYPDTKTETLADLLGLTATQVYAKARALGLTKSHEYLASPDACRLRRGDNIGAAYRFKPGQRVWNKGMKGLDIGGKATRFKPGRPPRRRATTSPSAAPGSTRTGFWSAR